MRINNCTTPVKAATSIALGNDSSISNTWTVLRTEYTSGGSVHAAGKASVVNQTEYQLTYTWNSVTTTATIQDEGLCYSPVSDLATLFAAASIPTTNVISGDTLHGTGTVNIPPA